MNTEAVHYLETATKENWLDWISDIVTHGFAHPAITAPKIDKNSYDQLGEVFECFALTKLSSKNYQEAIVQNLEDYAFDAEKSYRFISILSWCKGDIGVIEVADTLVGLFCSLKYESVKTDQGMFKSEILQLLSHCVLRTDMRDMIEIQAKNYLPLYLKDCIYCSALIRFSYRQYIGSSDKYFENFLLILQTLSEEDCTEGMQIVLVDKLEEFEYHHPEIFHKNFAAWHEKALVIPSYQLLQKNIRPNTCRDM